MIAVPTTYELHFTLDHESGCYVKLPDHLGSTCTKGGIVNNVSQGGQYSLVKNNVCGGGGRDIIHSDTNLNCTK